MQSRLDFGGQSRHSESAVFGEPMAAQGKNALALGLAGLLVVAGSFAAGYLLMARPLVPPPLPPAAAPVVWRGPHVVIKSALYGDLPDGHAADVTAKVSAALTADGVEIAATNANFGDPAEGIVKKLQVEFLLDGKEHVRTVTENEMLTISPGPVRLAIRKAVYGDLPNGKVIDVTEKVNQAADVDHLSIEATNENFGDPVMGIVKKLRVDYTLDGKAFSRTVEETETLTIPDGN